MVKAMLTFSWLVGLKASLFAKHTLAFKSPYSRDLDESSAHSADHSTQRLFGLLSQAGRRWLRRTDSDQFT